MPTVRTASRVLLLNNNNELLLMKLEGFDIATPGGKRHSAFWCTVGGGIESGETIEQAALREILEETGIGSSNIQLGPVVWHSVIELVRKGMLTALEEYFIVARTDMLDVDLYKPSADERSAVKELRWFSFVDIQNSADPIFPVSLPHHLPDVLAGNYPEKPINIT